MVLKVISFCALFSTVSTEFSMTFQTQETPGGFKLFVFQNRHLQGNSTTFWLFEHCMQLNT